LRPVWAELERPISKITRVKWAGKVAQVEHLLCKCDALSLIPTPTKKKKKERERTSIFPSEIQFHGISYKYYDSMLFKFVA
jgi:hypothetical protein